MRLEAQQQAAAVAAAKAASVAARAAQLQRKRQERVLQRIYGTDEDTLQQDDDIDADSSYDAEPSSSSQRASGSGAGGTRRPCGTHSQRCVNFELNFQQHTNLGVKYRIMMSDQLAAAKQQDLERILATKQQRVNEYVQKGAVHPGCTHHAVVVDSRPVLMCSLQGNGVVTVPTLQ